MSQGVVVDASVAIKLVLEEELSDQALALVKDTTEAGKLVIGPPLLPSEVTSAIYQRMRGGRPPAVTITEREAETALSRFVALGIERMEPVGLYQQAYGLARLHSLRNVYDAIYVALAQILGMELWTADRPLATTLGASSPWVKWIGTYPLTEY
jgi:predicted nucleic acid-binding protein